MLLRLSCSLKASRSRYLYLMLLHLLGLHLHRPLHLRLYNRGRSRCGVLDGQPIGLELARRRCFLPCNLLLMLRWLLEKLLKLLKLLLRRPLPRCLCPLELLHEGNDLGVAQLRVADGNTGLLLLLLLRQHGGWSLAGNCLRTAAHLLLLLLLLRL